MPITTTFVDAHPVPENVTGWPIASCAGLTRKRRPGGPDDAGPSGGRVVGERTVDCVVGGAAAFGPEDPQPAAPNVRTANVHRAERLIAHPRSIPSVTTGGQG
jgi:hypothetical protein